MARLEESSSDDSEAPEDLRWCPVFRWGRTAALPFGPFVCSSKLLQQQSSSFGGRRSPDQSSHVMCAHRRPTRQEFQQPFSEYVGEVFRRHPDLPMFKVPGGAGAMSTSRMRRTQHQKSSTHGNTHFHTPPRPLTPTAPPHPAGYPPFRLARATHRVPGPQGCQDQHAHPAECVWHKGGLQVRL